MDGDIVGIAASNNPLNDYAKKSAEDLDHALLSFHPKLKGLKQQTKVKPNPQPVDPKTYTQTGQDGQEVVTAVYQGGEGYSTFTSVDGREIYTAEDLRVGLFTSTDDF